MDLGERPRTSSWSGNKAMTDKAKAEKEKRKSRVVSGSWDAGKENARGYARNLCQNGGQHKGVCACRTRWLKKRTKWIKERSTNCNPEN